MTLCSVLCVWGEEPSGFNDAKQNIAKLKEKQPEVISNAMCKKVIKSEDEKIAAESTLNKTFAFVDIVSSIYEKLESNTLFQEEIVETFNDFIKDYKTAIFDDKGEKISITSQQYLRVAEKYSDKFNSLCNSAINFLNRQESTEGSIDNGQMEEDDESADNEANRTNEEHKPKSSNLLWIIIGISLALALFGVSIGIFSLVKLNSFHDYLKEKTLKIEGAQKSINLKIEEIQSSINRRTSSFEYSRSTTQENYNKPTRQELRLRRAHVESAPQRDVHIPSSKEKSEVDTTYLYATVSARSILPEFIKVMNDNPGDRVFMLTLAQPDADVAEFSIVPSMSADFKQSVINDHDTYLSHLFCDKSLYSSNPTDIVVDAVGKAKKVDGKWQVQDRMAIRLV